MKKNNKDLNPITKKWALDVLSLLLDSMFFQIIFIALFIFGIIYILAYVVCFGKNGISEDITDWANFGTYLGGLGGVFTAVTFLYLFLSNRRDKLIRNDERKQNDFFRYCELLKTVKNNLYLVRDGKETQGNQILTNFVELHNSPREFQLTYLGKESDPEVMQLIYNFKLTFHQEKSIYESIIKPYISALNIVLKKINQMGIDSEMYFQLLQSQFTYIDIFTILYYSKWIPDEISESDIARISNKEQSNQAKLTVKEISDFLYDTVNTY